MELKRMTTTVGRVMFNQAVPKTVPFINELLTKRNLKGIIGDIIIRTSFKQTAEFLDNIKELGFGWSFRAGLSFNLGDLLVPDMKRIALAAAQIEVDEVWDNYNMGLITYNERYNQIIDRWTSADNRITNTLMDELATHNQGLAFASRQLVSSTALAGAPDGASATRHRQPAASPVDVDDGTWL